ncbi:MAG: AAA family ATPase [Trueperaceae bacterium]|nr:AAA family ATPase [Trueperaceae bacterium]
MTASRRDAVLRSRSSAAASADDPPIAPVLSDEQRRAVDLAAGGHDGAIVARAGSGKTYTLRAVAQRTAPRPTVLLAFNRAIADEARGSFPAHVRTTTLHALAFRSVVAPDARMRAKLAAASGGRTRTAWTELAGLDPHDPGANGHVEALRALLSRFTASADDTPNDGHLPAALRARLVMTLGTERAAERTRWLVRRVRRAWERMVDPDDPAALDHDGYLKLFDLRGTRIDAELLLVDEAQDLAPVMLSTLQRQAGARLLVGDPAQRIYGWRGAVDAMAASGYPEVRLTRSFRFGPEIADVARRVLHALAPGARLAGVGPSGDVSLEPIDRGDARAVLCRTNLGVIEATLAFADEGVHVVGGLDATVASLRAAHALWARRGVRGAPGGGRGRGGRGGRGAPPARDRTPAQGGPADRAPSTGFASWDELVEAAEVQGGALRTLRRLVDTHGNDVPGLCSSLLDASRPSERDAPIVLSTVHRAKGREWDHVELWSDLPRVAMDADALARAPDPEAARAELNLLYVAVTRARRRLSLARTNDDLRELLAPLDERVERVGRTVRGA